MSCPSLLETPLPRGGSTRRSKNKANSVPRRRRFTLTRVSTRGSFLKRHDYTRRNTRTASVKNLPCTLNLPWLNDLLSNSGCVLFPTWRLDFSWISGLQDLQRPWQDCRDLDKYDWETKMNKIRYWKRPYATQLGDKTAKTIACVAWRFWLGALSNKGGRGQRNRFAARSRALRGRITRLHRSCAPAPGSTKPPRYAGY